MRGLVLVEDGLGRFEVAQVAVLGGQEDPLLVGRLLTELAADGLVLDDIADCLADQAGAA